jgi:hypothetical protein
MAKLKRDYAAEYARRIANGLREGRTRAQARGHPGVGQRSPPKSRADPDFDEKLEDGFRKMRDGKSLAQAAKEVHVAPERLRRYVTRQGVAERRGRRWVVLRDTRRRRVQLYSNGEERVITVGSAEAKSVGGFMSSVGQFLETNDTGYISFFTGASVVDVHGKAHPFETDPNTLYRLAHSGGETFDNIYRIVAP